MYIVIVGAGDIGTALLGIATTESNEVVVIERDPDRAERASKQYDCLVLNDDATLKETPEDAGVARADALISTTDQDATNIMVCLLAAEFDVPHIVSVVHNPEHMALFERIGVNTMENPQSLIAEYLYRAVSRPSVVDFMHIGEQAEVFEIVVQPDGTIVGETLKTANEQGLIGEEMLVVAIERESADGPITPRGHTVVEAGDVVTVYSADGVTPDATEVFGHAADGG